MYLSKSKSPPTIRQLWRKNILLLTSQNMSHSTCLYQPGHCLTVSFCTVSAFTSLTLTPNIPIHFPVIPQHATISLICCIGYTALFRTPDSHLWWDALPCYYGLHWLIHVHFLVYKLTWTHDNSQFSPQMVLRIYIHVFWISLSCLWSNQSEFMALFLICRLVQVLFLSLVVNFSTAIFCYYPWTRCSQVHILTSYSFCGAQWLRIAQSKWSTRLGVSLPTNGNTAAFQNIMLL